MWQSDYEWIQKEMGASITKRKIRKLWFKHNGKPMVAEVGQPNPYSGFPIRAIYEDAWRGTFLICGGSITIAPKDSSVEEY
jgi:hypothetical protein